MSGNIELEQMELKLDRMRLRLNPPIPVPLTVLAPMPCPYIPGQTETLRAVQASMIPSETYVAFMDRGFRRSGRMIYQPICEQCSECKQLRVPVREFELSHAQKRCWKHNTDLNVQVGMPQLTQEKYELYRRYTQEWHGRQEPIPMDSLETFLYDSPTETREFEYRDQAGKLVAIGICDLGLKSLSSVYFYFDPDEHKRGVGTFGALYEIQWCRERNLDYYYLGFWIKTSSAMSYKKTFRPNEVLDSDGQWKRDD